MDNTHATESSDSSDLERSLTVLLRRAVEVLPVYRTAPIVAFRLARLRVGDRPTSAQLRGPGL